MADPIPPRTDPATPADATRLALIRAALDLFGRKGFDATSTREIASLARTNVASIAYHFGGKEGLREGCAHHVVRTIRSIAGPLLAETAAEALPDGEDAEARIAATAERVIGIIVARPEAGEFAQFVLREVSRPGPAFDILYSGVFEPMHRKLCALWERATGELAESERTRLTVFTLVGQVVYFRIAREAVVRRMGWTTVGGEQAAAIGAVAAGNIRAMIRARRR